MSETSNAQCNTKQLNSLTNQASTLNTKHSKVDVIIIGQGLAGSILAYKLIQQGKTVAVFNDCSTASASEIAIGLTNPITGKRLVKSWLIDELIETSIPFYKQLEKEAQQEFIVPTRISRIIPNADIFEQWQPNFVQAAEEHYIDRDVKQFEHKSIQLEYFDILQSYWLQTKPLLQYLRTYITEKGIYRNQKVDYDTISTENNQVRIADVIADKLIFCEGAQGAKNPYTEHLPFNLNKGEVIRVKSIENYTFENILKKNIFIVPDGDTYRVGATYDRDFTTEEPTPKAIEYFNKKLSELDIENVEITEHKAAVRPATVDRRPLLGHLENNLYIFNGFGAKGVSLAPYFANHFYNYLFKGEDLLKEVDIARCK